VRHKPIPYTVAYAWTLELKGQETMCAWAEPTSKRLKETPKPSDESRVAKVAIVPFEYMHEFWRREAEISARERRCAAMEYNSEQYLKMKRAGLGEPGE
jgi:hypothetical protein